MKKKEESKESVYTVWERMIKRHVKSLCRQTFEKQMFEEFRLFLYGAMKILDEQNNFFSNSNNAENNTLPFQLCKISI